MSDSFTRIRDRALQRAKRVLKPRYRPLVVRAARAYRTRLRSVAFIGVTGSCGKTTTKELIAAVASQRFRGGKTQDTSNHAYALARMMFSLPPGSRFGVAELAGSFPGLIDELLAVLRPQIGVVTNVGSDHFKAYRSLEAIAAEKGKLVEALPPDGCAVLNADDALVASMAERTAARVITYGTSPEAMVRGTDLAGGWPDRLSLTATYAGETCRVRTRLCGAHWASSVLAALAAGAALDVPLAEAAEALAAVEPWLGRMSPMRAGGVTFVRDDWKAPYWSLPVALDFLRGARAPRKILVVGTLSDYTGDSRNKYVTFARQALEVADHLIFVGPHARSVRKVEFEEDGASLRSFATARDAAAHLESFLREGDLVLIKGSHQADHLARLALAHERTVGCWRERCPRKVFCDRCALLEVPESRHAAAGSGIRPGVGAEPTGSGS